MCMHARRQARQTELPYSQAHTDKSDPELTAAMEVSCKVSE